MGKRFWIWIVLVITIVLGLVCTMMLVHGDGPSYRGKTLAGWIHDLPAPGSNSRGISWAPLAGSETAGQSKAIQATQHIGTNGLPYLLGEMRTGKIGVKDRAGELWANIKEKWQKLISRKSAQQFQSMQPQSRMEKTEAERRHWDAARGLHALGPLAKPAIPELTQILRNGDSSSETAYALSGMGPEGLSALLDVLTNGVAPNRGDWPQLCIIWALGQTPETGRQAVPQLLEFLHDKDWTLRMGAAWSLGQLDTQPEVIAPALAETLGDTAFNVRPMTEQALRAYGITSVSRTSLLKYLDDPKLHVRMAATNALRVLFPEEAVKAGIPVMAAATNAPSQ